MNKRFLRVERISPTPNGRAVKIKELYVSCKDVKTEKEVFMRQYTLYYRDCINNLQAEKKELLERELYEMFNVSVSQIASCQAWLIETPHFKLLQSYTTLVAIIDYEGNIYCSGTYSRTTISHIGRFAKLYGLSYFDFKAVIK